LARKPVPLWKRWFEKVQIESWTGCWLWTGARRGGNQLRDEKGPYGGIRDDRGRLVYAHRVSLWLFFGVVVPYGHHVHHACRVRLCVNPFHLRVVEAEVNLREAAAVTNDARRRNPAEHPSDKGRLDGGEGELSDSAFEHVEVYSAGFL